jgi:hypothetical protein
MFSRKISSHEHSALGNILYFIIYYYCILLTMRVRMTCFQGPVSMLASTVIYLIVANTSHVLHLTRGGGEI